MARLLIRPFKFFPSAVAELVRIFRQLAEQVDFYDRMP
jgi:hypothetical protein